MITFLSLVATWVVAGFVGFLFSYKNVNYEDRKWLVLCIFVWGPILALAALVDEVTDQYYDHSGR